ncbi:MAG: 2TM domain-containing protein [Actinomycetota bacterium]|nr:2TM domain-containing protein [Actinomycetota bacterium]
MDEFGELAVREREAKRIARRQWFWLHFAVYATSQIFLVIVWALGTTTYPWYIYPLFGWGIFVAAHAVFAFVIRHPDEILIQQAAKRQEGQP